MEYPSICVDLVAPSTKVAPERQNQKTSCESASASLSGYRLTRAGNSSGDTKEILAVVAAACKKNTHGQANVICLSRLFISHVSCLAEKEVNIPIKVQLLRDREKRMLTSRLVALAFRFLLLFRESQSPASHRLPVPPMILFRDQFQRRHGHRTTIFIQGDEGQIS